jgi:hypothetical protein
LELVVVDIESDIDLDFVVEHSLVDLSRRSLDDSSNLDCKCWNIGYSTLRILSLPFIEELQSNTQYGTIHYRFHK